MRTAVTVTFISHDPDFNLENLTYQLKKSGIDCDFFAPANGGFPVLNVSFREEPAHCGLAGCKLGTPHTHGENIQVPRTWDEAYEVVARKAD